MGQQCGPIHDTMKLNKILRKIESLNYRDSFYVQAHQKQVY